MSRIQANKIYYFRILKISLIISLSIIIVLFYSFPKFGRLAKSRTNTIQIEVYISDIPVTQQPKDKRLPVPQKPKGYIPVPGIDEELPAELNILQSKGIVSGTNVPMGVPVEIAAKPILEIYPQVSGVTCKGVIRLLLLVNRFGRIESVEILENTTSSKHCLKLAIQAAKKSRWIPAKVNNEIVDSWVTKIYKFNIKE